MPQSRDSEPFSRSDLEAALDASDVGIWSWDIVSGQVDWTCQLERLFGFELGSFDGKFETYRDCILPDDQPKVLGAIQRALHAREGYFVDHRIIRRGTGEVRRVECRGTIELSEDGKPRRMTGTVFDVTRRDEVEERLRRADEITRLLNDFASDYVYSAELASATLTPTVVAGSFQRVTGYTAEQVAERGGWLSVIHKDDRPSFLKLQREGYPTRPYLIEYRIVASGGEVRWLRDHVRPQSDHQGRVVRLLGSVQDITERRRLEDQVQQSRKMEALARLAGGVAHDYNNLLTVIFSGIELLRRAPRSELEQDALDAIATSAERAAELTRSLLALGRRQMAMVKTVALNDAVGQARPLLEQSLGPSARLEVSLTAPGCSVRVDLGQLQLVLLNLVLNASDAMEGEGLVQLVAREADFRAGDGRRPAELGEGRYAAIDVIDSGHGITPEVLPHIFEPFFTTKAEGKGTGLGLAICHSIVTQLGGTLSVRSRPNEGATFTVYVPVSQDAADALPVVSRVSSGGNESILLVEDEPRLRALAARSLRERGYAVVEASSGDEALAISEAVMSAVSLLISDIRMPGMDGVSLSRALQSRWPRMRVLLTSGYTADDMLLAKLAGGTVPFLSKPFTPDGLARRVREVLEQTG